MTDGYSATASNAGALQRGIPRAPAAGRPRATPGCLRAGVLLMAALLVGASGCAKTGRPSGGPVDKTPPKVVSHQPTGDATGVSPDASVEIVFSEPMDPTATPQALFVSPESRLGVKLRGRVMRLEMELQPDRTYVVTVGTDARDLRGNRLSKSYTFAFATGIRLNRGQITGSAYRDHQPASGAHVWAYDLAVAGEFGHGAPQYRTQTGADGSYAFARLAAGQYRVLAFADEDRDREPDPDEWLALPSADLAVTEGDTARAGDLALTSPGVQLPQLVRLRALDQQRLLLQFSGAVDVDSLQLQIQGLAVDMLYGAPGDRSKVYAHTAPQERGREYRVQRVALNGTVLEWSTVVRGSGRADQSVPAVLAPQGEPQVIGVHDTLVIEFSAAMGQEGWTPFWAGADSVITPAGSWHWISALALGFGAQEALPEGAHQWTVMLPGAVGLTGNALQDSAASFNVNVLADEQLAAIQGRAAADAAVTVTAQSGARSYTAHADSSGAFLLSGLLPGAYTLHAYADANANGRHDAGALEPFAYAEPYTRWPQLVELAAGDLAQVRERTCR
jgi:uncharacterized protein (DUF2141 family)